MTRSEALKKVGAVLLERDYQQVRGSPGIWKWSIRPGIWGWLGLNTGRGPEAKAFAINPVIGIRHDQVEKVVDSLQGSGEGYFVPTISSNIGHFRDPPEYVEFVLWGDASDDSVCRDIVDAIDTEGRPAVEPLADFEKLILAMKEKKIGIKEMSQLRYPIILSMLGEDAHVPRMISDVLAACDGKDDAGHASLRRYFEGLRAWRRTAWPDRPV